MYIPAAFNQPDPAWAHDLIRRNAFGTLVTVDEAGAPFATHLPFTLDEARGPQGTLVAHMARANPQWRHFAHRKPVLAIFQGPHAYISPRWYDVHPSVPTWNYVAVHATGVPAIIDDPARIHALLARLSATYEAGAAEPWRFEALPPEYVAGMVKAIVAFDLPIEKLEAKAKLSQNRPKDKAKVVAALAASAEPLDRAVAELMETAQK